MRRISQSLREQVRQQAEKHCEYCRLLDGVGRFSHHVDHIIPIAHGGITDLSNLAWACFDCNTNKIRDIASLDPETRALTPLYNPRSQRWDDHFEMDGAYIFGKTPAGRATVRLLQMNNPDQIETRRRLINSGHW